MNKLLSILLLLSISCDTGNLTLIGSLPNKLKEVSGTETIKDSNLIWMHNDGGNKSKLYALNTKGNIIKKLKIDAKNNDWEDLTSDENGNLYIGNFGNNKNKKKKFSILKIKKLDLESDTIVSVNRISFYYPQQKKFPPKKNNLYYDCEAFFYFNHYFYLFTKSRVASNYGKTSLYKVPAKAGHHPAILVDSFNTCNDMNCWVTSADISNDGKKIALLTPSAVWVFTNFKDDDFFGGTAISFPFDLKSQKEGVSFKNNETLYITDEKAHDQGGNLYEFSLK